MAKHIRTSADPRADSALPRGSWDDRVKQNFRSVLTALGFSLFYLSVAAIGIGTHRYWLTPIGVLGAVVLLGSFYTWLSPRPPTHSWMAWVWMPLVIFPVAIVFAFRPGSH